MNLLFRWSLSAARSFVTNGSLHIEKYTMHSSKKPESHCIPVCERKVAPEATAQLILRKATSGVSSSTSTFSNSELMAFGLETEVRYQQGRSTDTFSSEVYEHVENDHCGDLSFGKVLPIRFETCASAWNFQVASVIYPDPKTLSRLKIFFSMEIIVHIINSVIWTEYSTVLKFSA